MAPLSSRISFEFTFTYVSRGIDMIATFFSDILYDATMITSVRLSLLSQPVARNVYVPSCMEIFSPVSASIISVGIPEFMPSSFWWRGLYMRLKYVNTAKIKTIITQSTASIILRALPRFPGVFPFFGERCPVLRMDLFSKNSFSLFS